MMSESAEAVSQRIIRRLSENELSNIREARARIISQEADFAKWMVASLLALNGGVGLALWSSDEIPVEFRAAASLIFVFGVLLAISTSYFVYVANRAILSNLHGWERYWILASETGAHDDHKRGELDKEFAAAFAKTSMTPKAGIFSALAFLLGCVVAAVGMLRG